MPDKHEGGLSAMILEPVETSSCLELGSICM